MNQNYLETARFLTHIAPLVFAGDEFALKGGTAINLFMRDMPRLSVDLDLIYRDHRAERNAALDSINHALVTCAKRLNSQGIQTRLSTYKDAGVTKLFASRDKVEVKVEVNFVMRGTIYPVDKANLTPKAQDLLLADLDIPVVSLAEAYGSKLVAAMDRQHPRDLFDVMQLFAHEGITPEIRRAFVAYLACHNRPIHEVLFPKLRDVRAEYEYNFKGMTADPVELSELLKARDQMVTGLQEQLDANERQFLLSLVANKPEWDRLDITHLQDMPGIRWKLRNLQKLEQKNPRKFATQYAELKERLM